MLRAGKLTKLKKITTEKKAEHSRFGQPNCHLASLQTTTNIHINIIGYWQTDRRTALASPYCAVITGFSRPCILLLLYFIFQF